MVLYQDWEKTEENEKFYKQICNDLDNNIGNEIIYLNYMAKKYSDCKSKMEIINYFKDIASGKNVL